MTKKIKFKHLAIHFAPSGGVISVYFKRLSIQLFHPYIQVEVKKEHRKGSKTSLRIYLDTLFCVSHGGWSSDWSIGVQLMGFGFALAWNWYDNPMNEEDKRV